MDQPHTTVVTAAGRRWLSVNELAAHFGKDRATMYRWLRLGMPGHRPGGSLLFDLDEVEAWVRSRCSTDGRAQESAA
jgi:excisionase family DNA binding protein